MGNACCCSNKENFESKTEVIFNQGTPPKCMKLETRPEDYENIKVNKNLEYDTSGLSMTDMISNSIVIVKAILTLIESHLSKNQLLKAVCRRLQCLEPCLEELKSKNSQLTKDFVINLVHIVNRIKEACEKLLAGKESIWDRVKDAVNSKSQIKELHDLNDLLTRAQNDLQIPLAAETQKKMEQNFKKMLELFEKSENTFKKVKEKSVLPLAKAKLTNEEAFLFWFRNIKRFR